MREWNAESYHAVSGPQFAWGQQVLATIALTGTESALDVGCGTGRLTQLLAETLPRGRTLGLDASMNMVRVARAQLPSALASRVSFVCADALAIPCTAWADLIVSMATFHWVLDHPALFRSLRSALKPGGRLVAQCGGGPNLARLTQRAAGLMTEEPFARFFAGWRTPWEFADAPTTAMRLREAGFIDVETSLVPAAVVQPDAAAYATFLTTVVCHPHLAHLPDDAAKRAFIGALTGLAAADDPPFELDYWRLNLTAQRPPR
jgi:trans-aconitate 2-methyltransferase